jgi:hypothetical protein
MVRLRRSGSPASAKPPGIDPPRWLLALGVAAVVLLPAGAVVGGEVGGWLIALACAAIPTLAGVFVGLLAFRSLRPRDGR